MHYISLSCYVSHSFVQPALRGVSVAIKRGEFIVILGKSGGGKTSMLNCIGTIDKPTRGDIFVCGTRIDSRTADATLADIRLRKLGFVFQQVCNLHTKSMCN